MANKYKNRDFEEEVYRLFRKFMQEYEQKKSSQIDSNSDDEIASLKCQIRELAELRDENNKKISELIEKELALNAANQDLEKQISDKDRINLGLEQDNEQLNQKITEARKVLEGYSESERLWNLFLSLDAEVRESLGFISSAGRVEFIITLFDRGSVDRLYEWLACRLSRNDEAVRAVLELYSAAVCMYCRVNCGYMVIRVNSGDEFDERFMAKCADSSRNGRIVLESLVPGFMPEGGSAIKKTIVRV